MKSHELHRRYLISVSLLDSRLTDSVQMKPCKAVLWHSLFPRCFHVHFALALTDVRSAQSALFMCLATGNSNTGRADALESTVLSMSISSIECIEIIFGTSLALERTRRLGAMCHLGARRVFSQGTNGLGQSIAHTPTRRRREGIQHSAGHTHIMSAQKLSLFSYIVSAWTSCSRARARWASGRFSLRCIHVVCPFDHNSSSFHGVSQLASCEAIEALPNQ